MRQSRLSGSVEGVMGNHDSYSDLSLYLCGGDGRCMLPSRAESDHRENLKLICSFSEGRGMRKSGTVMPRATAQSIFRFGDFELDLGAYELRRRGKPVRMERRPMDLLTLLVERRNQLVSRSDIVGRLWV